MCAEAAGSLHAVVRPSSRALDVLGTLVRLGLAGVWLTSGTLKALDSSQTYAAVNAYKVLPSGMVSVVAAGLPFAELALGVLLLLGIGTRLVAAFSCLFLLAFITGVSQAWARGLAIDCGCFGGGGNVAASQTQYPQELARDAGFILLAVWLLVRARTLLSLDRLLLGTQTGEPEAQAAAAE
jgi:uncharacterized membrane protein YphA (DoxX/SURF4 family)